MTDLSYEHQRIAYSQGAWADVHIAHFPAERLQFMEFQTTNKRSRLVEICKWRLLKAERRGEAHPVIIVYEAPSRGPASQLLPDIDVVTDAGEHLIDAVSVVNYVMRQILLNGWARLHFDTKSSTLTLSLAHKDLPNYVSAVWDWLNAADHLYVYSTSQSAELPIPFDIDRNLVGIAECDFMGDFVHGVHHPLVFNTTFFLLEHDDYVSHHSRLGEAYNLHMEAGEIMRPPLYNRAALLKNHQGWYADRINLSHIVLELPDGTHLTPGENLAINPQSPTEICLYTRAYSKTLDHQLLGESPQNPDRIEFVVINQHIASKKYDGGLPIPQNGFVLSFSEQALSIALENALLTHPVIRYHWKTPHPIQMGIQGGGLLLKNGQIMLDENTFIDEEFYPQLNHREDSWQGVVPRYFPYDVDQTRAARMGIGVKEGGDLVVVAIDGVNGHLRTERDSHGATLIELATCLRNAGAVDAINLDGGGSTQMYYLGGEVTRSSDRRSMANILFERIVPSVGIVPAIIS